MWWFKKHGNAIRLSSTFQPLNPSPAKICQLWVHHGTVFTRAYCEQRLCIQLQNTQRAVSAGRGREPWLRLRSATDLSASIFHPARSQTILPLVSTYLSAVWNNVLTGTSKAASLNNLKSAPQWKLKWQSFHCVCVCVQDKDQSVCVILVLIVPIHLYSLWLSAILKWFFFFIISNTRGWNTYHHHTKVLYSNVNSSL